MRHSAFQVKRTFGRAAVVNTALVLLLIVLTSCGTAPTQTVSPSVAATGTPPPAATATATNTAIPSPTPTPKLPVSVGTTLPRPSGLISPETANQIVELARWGKGVISAISYSPEGKTIALGGASGITFVDPENLKEVNSIESNSPTTSVAFSYDGTLAAAGLENGTAVIWDIKTGHLLQTLTGPSELMDTISFSPDGQLFAGGSDDGTVTVWKVVDGSNQGTFKSDPQTITALEFSPDGQSLFVGSEGGSIHQLRIPDGKILRVFGGYANAGISLSADGSRLAAGGAEFLYQNKGTIRVWTVADGKLLTKLDAKTVTSVAISPDGQLVAAGGDDHTAYVWKVSSGESDATYADLKPKEDAPQGKFSITFSPAGDTLVMGGLDVVGVWNVQNNKLVTSAKTHSFPIYGIAISPDNKLLASVGYVDVQLRSLVNGETISLNDNVTGFTDAAFSPDGKSLALGSQDGKASIWPLNDLAHPQVFESANGGKIRGIAFSPDGKTLAFSSETPEVWNWTYMMDVSSGKIQLNNITDGTLIQSLDGSGIWYVSELFYSPSGDMLASVAPGDCIRVFRTADSARLYLFSSGVSAAFSSDGSLLAGTDINKNIHVWKMSNGTEILKIPSLPEIMWTIAFSPDGKLLAAGDEKGTLRIWNVADGKLLKSWAGHSSYVNDLMFLSDGTMLITASGDGTIRFWGLKP